MSNKRITDLTELTTLTANDVFPVVDIETNITKKIKASNIVSPPSGVSGAIQFSNGSAFASDATNLFWDDTNDNLGIGTNNPTARLHIVSPDKNGIVEIFRNGQPSAPFHYTRYGGNVPINLNASGGTAALPVPLADNAIMSRLTTNTYNGSAFANAARIEVLSKGTQSATNYGTNMRFFTTPENTTEMVEVFSLLSDGNVQVGSSFATPLGARLGIRGKGSTSATASLIVQNSGGNEALKVRDDRVIIMSGMPTSALGLPSGALWNDSGTIKIV